LIKGEDKTDRKNGGSSKKRRLCKAVQIEDCWNESINLNRSPFQQHRLDREKGKKRFQGQKRKNKKREKSKRENRERWHEEITKDIIEASSRKKDDKEEVCQVCRNKKREAEVT